MKTFNLFAALVLGASCTFALPALAGDFAPEAWRVTLETNDIKLAQSLISAPGFDPMAKNAGLKSSPLAAALSKERVKIAGLMLDHARNDSWVNDETVLDGLTRAANFPLFKRASASPKFKANSTIGGTPLLNCMANMGSVDGVKLLLKRPDIKPMARDEEGNTALHAVNASRSGSIAGLLLADKRLDPNAQNKKGDTALHEAADFGDVGILKRILADSRTNPNLKNLKGQTPLFVGASSDMEYVRALMANKRVKVGPKEKAQIKKLKKAGGSFGTEPPG